MSPEREPEKVSRKEREGAEGKRGGRERPVFADAVLTFVLSLRSGANGHEINKKNCKDLAKKQLLNTQL